MAKTEHYYTQFEPGHFYHIYNRSVDLKPMFRSVENYRYFLNQYLKYSHPVLETYAFCLLGNHFHLLVRIRDLDTLQKFSVRKTDPHEIVSHQFQKFFQSYAMAFNKQHNRVGTLFQTPFKRGKIDNLDYLKNCIFYIHKNPQQHGLIEHFEDYPWSSYTRMLNDKPTHLLKEDVSNWFEGKENYLDFHQSNPITADWEKAFEWADG
jgi:putative transposase